VREVVPGDCDDCPRLWRRLGFWLATGVIKAQDNRGDQMLWSRLTAVGRDRHFYYWSGGAQDDVYRLSEATPATRAGRAHALVELVDRTCEDIAPVELSVWADAAAFERVERSALARHGLAIRRGSL
jgi:hypothetical protein